MLSEIDLRYIEGFDLVHSSCYAQVEDQLKRLRLDDLLVSFDFSSEERFRTNEYLSQICPMVDLALFSCEGMKKKELLNFAQRVQKFGCKNVLMTMGKYGQTLLTNEGRLYEGKAKLVKAIDTMGAGDSFFSAFIATLLNEGWKKNKSLSDKEVYDAFSAASAYSARICMVEGSFGMGLPIEFTEP
jgi:sugar/nucleoside kinase (ribokinase family)